MNVRLIKRRHDLTFRGTFTYLVVRVLDGRRVTVCPQNKPVFDVYVLNCDDPVTVGRELDLVNVRMLISDMERHSRAYVWMGDRSTVTNVLDDVLRDRRHR